MKLTDKTNRMLNEIQEHWNDRRTRTGSKPATKEEILEFLVSWELEGLLPGERKAAHKGISFVGAL